MIESDILGINAPEHHDDPHHGTSVPGEHRGSAGPHGPGSAHEGGEHPQDEGESNSQAERKIKMKEKTSPTMIALTLAVISILGLGGVTAEASAAENDEVRIAKIQIVNNQIIDAAAIDYADDYLRLDTDVQRITIADVTYELDMVTDAQLDFVVVDDLNTILDLDQIVDLNATVELDINPDIYDANLTALDFTDGINFEIKNVELMSNNIFDYTNVLPGRYIDRAAAIDQIEVDLELDDMGFVTIADQLSVDDITNNIPV